MIAFEVLHNGRRLCTAGVGDHGVLSAMVTWTLRDSATLAKYPVEEREQAACEELRIEVGGLADGVHQHWPSATLCPGDEVTVRICKTLAVNPPASSHSSDPDEDLARKRDYVREMCRELGWHLTES